MNFLELRSTSLFSLLILVQLLSCTNSGNNPEGKLSGSSSMVAPYGTPVLDGSASDEVWDLCEWNSIQQVWEGNKPEKGDFSGQYKMLWDENNLYILAEIQDDTLVDLHSDGLDRYWEDDCLVVLVDEDGSGGKHEYSHNAFAYHISLDSRVVDVASDSSYQYFDEHCVSRRTTSGNSSVWEIAVRLYDGNSYQDSIENIPKALQAGKIFRFALAYCDNDYSETRENLFGNISIPAGGSSSPLQDASLMGLIELR
jgi:hypothetical protein